MTNHICYDFDESACKANSGVICSLESTSDTSNTPGSTSDISSSDGTSSSSNEYVDYVSTSIDAIQGVISGDNNCWHNYTSYMAST